MKSLKLRIILASAIFACAGLAMPAFAQTAQQDLPEYIKDHPELQTNPALMSNPNYLARHPDLRHWLDTHPQVAPGRYRNGAWDSRYQWHDEDWWHRNDPNWVYQHHNDWIAGHPNWTNDGDYDDTHRWRDRQWWMHNHPNWVREHHPHWEAANEGNYHADEGHHGHGHAYGHDKDGHGHGHDKNHD
jgi:hypothetical protein